MTLFDDERVVEATARALYTFAAGGPDSEWYKHGVPWDDLAQSERDVWLAEATDALLAAHETLTAVGLLPTEEER